MAVTFVSSSSAQSTSNADPVLVPRPNPAPAGGDVIIADVVAPGSADPVITPPAGYLLVQGVYDPASTGVRLSQYRKVSAGNEAETDTWGKDVALGAVVAYSVYRGVDNATPVPAGERAIAVQSGTGVATRPTPSLVTAGPRMVHAAFCDASGSTWTKPAGTTQRQARTRTGGANVLVVDSGAQVAADTYQWTATASVATSVAVQGILALQPGAIADQAPTSAMTASKTAALEPGEQVTVTLTDADDGAIAARTLRQIDIGNDAPAVALPTDGPNREVVMPHTLYGTVIRLGYRVSDNTGQQSPETTVDLAVLPATERLVQADGKEVPLRREML